MRYGRSPGDAIAGGHERPRIFAATAAFCTSPAGLKQGDELSLLVRDDGAIEITHAAPGEAELQEAFEWSLGRYAKTYEDLAR